MSGKNFIVTLPVSASRTYDVDQYQVLLFIPDSNSSYYDNIITVQMVNSKVKEPVMTRSYDGTNYLFYMALSRSLSTLQQTYYITSTERILVVAAVTCTPVFTGLQGNCDYASYMPPPTYAQSEESMTAKSV